MHPILAIYLGALQGVSQFLPISSSAHMAILHRLFPSSSGNILFDVALRLGTLVALVAYFWREWWGIIQANSALRKLKDRTDPAYAELKAKSMSLWPLIVATIPGGLAGMLLEKKAEAILNTPMIIGSTMIVFGVLLYVADRSSSNDRPLQNVTLKDWIIVGCAQAFALIPGVSRSGSTITAGLFCGLRRESAARLSFILAAPIIFGAGLFDIRRLTGLEASDILPSILGLASSAVVGYIAIGYLIEYLKRRSTAVFMLYRVLFGLVVIASYKLGYLRG